MSHNYMLTFKHAVTGQLIEELVVDLAVDDKKLAWVLGQLRAIQWTLETDEKVVLADCVRWLDFQHIEAVDQLSMSFTMANWFDKLTMFLSQRGVIQHATSIIKEVDESDEPEPAPDYSQLSLQLDGSQTQERLDENHVD